MKILFSNILILLFSLILFRPLMALEIRLKSPGKFYNINGDIFVDLSTTDSLLSGDDVLNLNYDIPITVTYYIEFYEDHVLFDDLLVNLALVKRVYFDYWSGQYFIETGNKKIWYRNLTQLRYNMIHLKEVRLIEANKIDPNKKYYFKTRIAVKIKNFNLYYYLVNNLISIFKYKTTYYHSPVYTGKQIFQLIESGSKN